MIAKLTGTLDSITLDAIILNVQGVGYELYCSDKTISFLQNEARSMPAATLQVWVSTQFKNESLTLYGFAHTEEKACFLLLLTVQGVGARVALAILSVLTPQEVLQALQLQDAPAFQNAEGIGPKLAQRITRELKDKALSFTSFTLSGAENVVPLSSAPLAIDDNSAIFKDGTAALLTLGYRRSEIIGALAQTQKDLPPNASLDNVITHALQLLSHAS